MIVCWCNVVSDHEIRALYASLAAIGPTATPGHGSREATPDGKVGMSETPYDAALTILGQETAALTATDKFTARRFRALI
jgi:hypothetical protein